MSSAMDLNLFFFDILSPLGIILLATRVHIVISCIMFPSSLPLLYQPLSSYPSAISRRKVSPDMVPNTSSRGCCVQSASQALPLG